MRHLVIAALLVACGEDVGGGPSTPIKMFDASFKEAQCKHLVACGEFPDIATCTKYALGGTFTLSIAPQIEAAVLAGKMYYDGSKAAACLDLIAAATCDTTDKDSRTIPDVCKQLVRGGVAGGGACAFNEECVSDVCSLTCGGDVSCCQGTCVGSTPPPVVLAGIGQSCQTKGCVENAYCDSQTEICSVFKTSGQVCNATSECDYGLKCTGGSTMMCKPLPTLSQPCPDGLCRDEGQRCATSGGAGPAVCLALGLPGTPCTSNVECSSYFTCDLATSKCIAYPAAGQSCASTFMCADSASVYCDNVSRVCTSLKANGDVCQSSSECLSQRCDGGVGPLTCIDPASCI